MKRKSSGPDRHSRLEERPGNPPIEANPDLLLDEDSLVRLAMRELNGRLPPGFQPRSRALHIAENGGRDAGGAGLGANGGELLPPHRPRTMLSHEMEMRGWTTRDLAIAMGLTPSEIMALAKGHQRVTPEIARRLALAFATSEEFWL